MLTCWILVSLLFSVISIPFKLQVCLLVINPLKGCCCMQTTMAAHDEFIQGAISSFLLMLLMWMIREVRPIARGFGGYWRTALLEKKFTIAVNFSK